MRIGIVAESFLPNVNGVTNSILRILEHIEGEHEAIVIAPGAREFQEEIPSYAGAQIVRVPTVRMPLINSLPIGVPVPAVTHALRSFAPDVIHLASPFVLGGYASFSARQLGIPAVAVYQTDVAGFATTYRLTPLAVAAWDWTRIIHNQAARTLARDRLTGAATRALADAAPPAWAMVDIPMSKASSSALRNPARAAAAPQAAR